MNIQKGEGIEKAEGSFRVMTWNVNGPVDDEYKTLKKGILEEIERLDPDILCFQELSFKFFQDIQFSLDSIFGYTDSMAVKKKISRFRLYSKKPIRNFKQYKCITEKDVPQFNILQLEEVEKLKKRMPVFSADIEVNSGEWITVFACHLRSSAYSTARRSMDEGSSWSDGIPLYLDNYKSGKIIRDWEADNLRIFLDSLETTDTPVIIAGDFNDWSGSYCMNTIRKDHYKDAWWESGIGFGITYDGWNMLLRLDHILYTHHFILDKIHLEKSYFSDHYPLIADFKLK